MKVYISHSKDFDFVNELYKPIRSSDPNKRHTFILLHEDARDWNMNETFKGVDLLVAEVSFPSTGQGIEIGWANMLKVPILCISKEGAKISGSLEYITGDFLTYTDSKDLIAKISGFLLK